MVQVGKDITWQDSLILENEVSVLNNVLYADLTGVFLVVGCTLFISLVNCLSEILLEALCIKVELHWRLLFIFIASLYQLGDRFTGNSRWWTIMVPTWLGMKSLLYFRPIHSDTPRELYSREGWRWRPLKVKVVTMLVVVEILVKLVSVRPSK